jgi:hypothetical protein
MKRKKARSKKKKARCFFPLELPQIGKEPLREAAKLLPSPLKRAASTAGSLMATQKNLKTLNEQLERLQSVPRLQDITFIGSSNRKNNR